MEDTMTRTSTPHRTWAPALAAAALALGALPAAAAAAPRPLLPDLTMTAPLKVSVIVDAGRQQLIFESVAINTGAGPLIVDGAKQSTDPEVPMPASQALLLSNGRIRDGAFQNAGEIYFDVDHFHWHYRAFQRFRLRHASNNATAAEDQKTGFCLGDRYIAVRTYRLPGQSYDPSPLFAEDCWSGVLDRTSIREGISVGWADDYAPRLEGQLIDVTSVPDGRYYLVHTVNPERKLHESDYANDSSSLLISLRRPAPGAAPALKILGTCPGTARCDPRRAPRVVAKPAIVNARVGAIARCTPGRWTARPSRFSYQWYRYGFILPSARSATYKVPSADAGKPLTCRVTAFGTYGARTARSPAAMVG
jgi:hypothetical protein